MKGILKHIKWSFISTISTQLMVFASITILANILEATDFGRFVILQTILANLMLLSTAGLSITCARYIPFIKNDKKKLSLIVSYCLATVGFFALIIVLLAYFFSSLLSELYFDDNGYSYGFIIISIAGFFVSVDGLLKNVLIGFGSTKIYAKSCVFGVVLYLPITILMTFKFDLPGAVIALLLNSVIQFFVTFWYSNKQLRTSGFAWDFKGFIYFKEVAIKFAFPALVSGLMVLPVHSMVQFILINYGEGVVQVAMLGIAMQWFNIFQLMPVIINRVLLPNFSESYAAGKAIDVANGVNKAMCYTLLVFSSLMIFSCMFLYSFGGYLYGDFPGVVKIIFLFLLASIIKGVLSPVGSMILSKGNVWLSVFVNLIWLITYLVLSFILVGLGALGIGVSILIAYSTQSAILFFINYKNIRKRGAIRC
ncbi:oligosaccharide flippase family protein [Vibrio cidicii]|uniref:oligosaccharide flippase family protein n=1 Tax=Vibrio cidicii TaxID=1763883 RepID=UPI00370426E9